MSSKKKNKKKILVIGAHPDDEVMGCGGAIIKHVARGDEVFILIFTKAYAPKWSSNYIQKQEMWQKNVDEFLGITKRYNLKYPTLHLNTIPHGDFADEITKLIKEITPSIIYTHFTGDLNLDHALLGRATKVAIRRFPFIKLLAYEIIVNTNNGTKPFKPNYYVSLGKNELMKKMEAYQKYEVESLDSKRLPKDMVNLARVRGNQIGKNYAEAFMLIREVW